MNETLAPTSGPLNPTDSDGDSTDAISQGTMIIYYIIILMAIFVSVLFWLVSPSRVRRVPPPPSPEDLAEEQAQRQQFVDANLTSKEWKIIPVDEENSVGTTDLVGLGSDAPEESECPVCLGPFENGDRVSASTNPDCPHIFHRDCVYKWLLRKEECPMCRHIFLVEPENPPARVENPPEDADDALSIVSTASGIRLPRLWPWQWQWRIEDPNIYFGRRRGLEEQQVTPSSRRVWPWQWQWIIEDPEVYFGSRRARPPLQRGEAATPAVARPTTTRSWQWIIEDPNIYFGRRRSELHLEEQQATPGGRFWPWQWQWIIEDPDIYFGRRARPDVRVN